VFGVEGGRPTVLRILVLHGPNLNLLGTREQSIYGTMSLETIDLSLHRLGEELGAQLVIRQSNHEGELVTWIQEARRDCQGIIINPAAYTHTSIAIRDALAAVDLPTVEVHLSNIYRRETFRQQSYVSGVAVAQVSGFGPSGYLLALRGLCEHVAKVSPTGSKPVISPADRSRTSLT